MLLKSCYLFILRVVLVGGFYVICTNTFLVFRCGYVMCNFSVCAVMSFVHTISLVCVRVVICSCVILVWCCYVTAIISLVCVRFVIRAFFRGHVNCTIIFVLGARLLKGMFTF